MTSKNELWGGVGGLMVHIFRSPQLVMNVDYRMPPSTRACTRSWLAQRTPRCHKNWNRTGICFAQTQTLSTQHQVQSRVAKRGRDVVHTRRHSPNEMCNTQHTQTSSFLIYGYTNGTFWMVLGCFVWRMKWMHFARVAYYLKICEEAKLFLDLEIWHCVTDRKWLENEMSWMESRLLNNSFGSNDWKDVNELFNELKTRLIWRVKLYYYYRCWNKISNGNRQFEELRATEAQSSLNDTNVDNFGYKWEEEPWDTLL